MLKHKKKIEQVKKHKKKHHNQVVPCEVVFYTVLQSFHGFSMSWSTTKASLKSEVTTSTVADLRIHGTNGIYVPTWMGKWVYGTCRCIYIYTVYIYIWMFPKIGTPKWMVKIMENPIKMDDLGAPLFSETSIFIYIYIHMYQLLGSYGL